MGGTGAGCAVERLGGGRGYVVTWLRGYMVTWLHGYMVRGLVVYEMRREDL